MATLGDIGLAAAINILAAIVFLLAFAILRLQPFNDRVYFPKWYLKKARDDPTSTGALIGKFVNLNYKTYFKFFSWIPDALKMPEDELIDHAGLDSAVYLRIYIVGLKIFIPLTILAFVVLVPVNATKGTVHDIDKLSMSNVESGSQRFWAHIVMAYVFAIWTCYVLYTEYETIATMRLSFLESEHRRPDQYTVLVRNVPPDPDESISEHIEHFFRVNYPEHYLTNQVIYNANKLAKLVEKKESLQDWLTYNQNKYDRNPEKRPTTKIGFLGLWGERVDALNFYTTKMDALKKEVAEERERVLKDRKCIMPVAFVSFRSRWGAAVCAQTQQCKNPTIWLTEWAPEPRDVFWNNLAIPFVELTVRRLLISVAVFFLVFFFMIPITFVQSLANIEGIEKAVPFLKPLIEVKVIKSFIQGFLPGLALKIFLIFLPSILMFMSKVEGHTSLSALEINSAKKYYYFILVNVFLGSIIAGTAFEQLKTFIHQSATEIPKTIGETIPKKATFFITYIMVDGWAGIAGEVLRLKPLIVFHIKNMLLVKTEKDREKAMDPGSVGFDQALPTLQLYFLLGLVYAVITPILLLFIVFYFGFAYLIFRHQVINVYNQEYESAAAFWPHVHSRIIAGLVISQILLLGLLSTRAAGQMTPVLIALPILTIWFHKFCKHRFEPAFRRYPIEEATIKDTLERVNEPNLNLKEYLCNAYMHPVFKTDEDSDDDGSETENWKDDDSLVPTKRQSQLGTPKTSKNLSTGTRTDCALDI
ncbi:CSC1-like protein At1g62320 [Cryptomeria japonica]|uniref:CSC1-like protein At1g62320 n=1 Tax=Cryptomeria japonica TaxID=3369 RepID=UPI0027DA3CB0|nr:CSC1-like protein At1g62320 [Cryptomeria japonica]XP_057852683.2 CSC1-like protein At1g62320 [Cryptomeria japonica]XP_057852684.2 CSC1-like protein At1g62320 [Cryptomeria japonica]